MIAERTSSESSADLYLDRPDQIVQRGLLLQPATYASVCFLLMLLIPEVPLLARLILIAGVLLTLRRWGAVVVLLLVQCDLFLREGRQIAILRGTDGLVLAFVTIATLMFVSRQRLLLMHLAGMSMKELYRHWIAGPTESSRTNVPANGSSSDSQATPADNVSMMKEPASDRIATTVQESSVAVFERLPSALRALAVLLGCVATARFLLSRIPRNSELTGQLRELVNEDPTLATGGLVLMILLAIWVVVGEISWRQLSPAQARVYLRSELLRETYSDLRMFVLRRIRRRQKRLLTTKSTSNTQQKSKLST